MNNKLEQKEKAGKTRNLEPNKASLFSLFYSPSSSSSSLTHNSLLYSSPFFFFTISHHHLQHQLLPQLNLLCFTSYSLECPNNHTSTTASNSRFLYFLFQCFNVFLAGPQVYFLLSSLRKDLYSM